MSDEKTIPVAEAVELADAVFDVHAEAVNGDEILPRIYEVEGEVLYGTQRLVLNQPVERLIITFDLKDLKEDSGD